MDDIVQIAHAAAAAIGAFVAAYGRAVLTKTEDQAADGTVRLGGRILASLRRKDRARPALDVAIQDLVNNPGDGDALAALRLQIRNLLADDPGLARQVRGMLGDDANPGAHNSHISVRQNDGIISTGSGAVNMVNGNGR